MKILPLPQNQLQEVLYKLLTNQTISVRQMMADTGILHPKARILDLRRIGKSPQQIRQISQVRPMVHPSRRKRKSHQPLFKTPIQ